MRYYGLDLRRVLWGPERFGARRIFALVVGLPGESGLYRMLAMEQAEAQPAEQPVRTSDPRQLRAFFPTAPPKGKG